MQRLRNRAAWWLFTLATQVGGAGWLVPIMRERQEQRRTLHADGAS